MVKILKNILVMNLHFCLDLFILLNQLLYFFKGVDQFLGIVFILNCAHLFDRQLYHSVYILLWHTLLFRKQFCYLLILHTTFQNIYFYQSFVAFLYLDTEAFRNILFVSILSCFKVIHLVLILLFDLSYESFRAVCYAIIH